HAGGDRPHDDSRHHRHRVVCRSRPRSVRPSVPSDMTNGRVTMSRSSRVVIVTTLMALALSGISCSRDAERSAASGGATAMAPSTAFVTSYGDNTVTPIDLATMTPGAPIPLGTNPLEVAITPDGKTALVTIRGDNTVTPVDVGTMTAGAPIPVGPRPFGLAVTPDGKTALVTNNGNNTVTPIDVA